jgi:hypothetical protein
LQRGEDALDSKRDELAKFEDAVEQREAQLGQVMCDV